MIDKIISIPRSAALTVIRLYQLTLSPDTGWFKARFPHGYCRFYPSCSEYAFRAIQAKGLIRGGLQGAWRIVRCNPFSAGGYDPVAKSQQQ